MIRLKEQTVHGAKTFEELRAMHQWKIPNDYNVAIDCLDRHAGFRDKVALIYNDDEGRQSRGSVGCYALRAWSQWYRLLVQLLARW